MRVDGFPLPRRFRDSATTVGQNLLRSVECLQGRAELSGHPALSSIRNRRNWSDLFQDKRLPSAIGLYLRITALGRVLIEIGGAEHKTGEGHSRSSGERLFWRLRR